ncbi:MAG: hypothetical protein J0I06_19535 [Planctomycetes bacterium]|nr:hypothetical protein [Planctomycetota bacterium]
MLTRTLSAARVLGAALVILSSGCEKGAKLADFPELSPVKGVVKRDGKPVKGGTVRFNPDPDKPEFLTNSEVKDDGTYSLTTVRTNDSKGERKPGAPPGKYKVSYIPALGDQTAGGKTDPVEVKDITVKTGDNDIPIDLPKK